MDMSRLELLGWPLSTVFPGGLPGLPWRGPAPSPMDRQPLRVSAPRRDGRPREVEVRLSPWLLKRARQGTRPEDTETAWRLEKAQRQSHKLARMMDELLDVSRLAEGRLRLELCDVDLVRVVREVLERFHAGGPPLSPAHLPAAAVAQGQALASRGSGG